MYCIQAISRLHIPNVNIEVLYKVPLHLKRIHSCESKPSMRLADIAVVLTVVSESQMTIKRNTQIRVHKTEYAKGKGILRLILLVALHLAMLFKSFLNMRQSDALEMAQYIFKSSVNNNLCESIMLDRSLIKMLTSSGSKFEP